jgi:hypothetical protein
MRAMDLDSAGYYSPDQDHYTMQNQYDPRRPKITIAHLNQMKRMRSAKKLENLVRRDLLGLLYGAPSAEGGGMPGM